MKQAGFGIIELSKKTIILPEAHAMNKSITQATQNDKQISCFFSFESVQCLQKERRSSNGNFPVSVSADFF